MLWRKVVTLEGKWWRLRGSGRHKLPLGLFPKLGTVILPLLSPAVLCLAVAYTIFCCFTAVVSVYLSFLLWYFFFSQYVSLLLHVLLCCPSALSFTAASGWYIRSCWYSAFSFILLCSVVNLCLNSLGLSPVGGILSALISHSLLSNWRIFSVSSSVLSPPAGALSVCLSLRLSGVFAMFCLLLLLFSSRLVSSLLLYWWHGVLTVCFLSPSVLSWWCFCVSPFLLPSVTLVWYPVSFCHRLLVWLDCIREKFCFC